VSLSCVNDTVDLLVLPNAKHSDRNATSLRLVDQ